MQVDFRPVDSIPADLIMRAAHSAPCIPAPSAASITAGSPVVIRRAGPPALLRPTVASSAEASTVEASTAAASVVAVTAVAGKYQESEIMCNSVKKPAKSSLRLKAVPLLAVPLAAYLQVAQAQPSNQWTFNSAEAASRALFVAVESHDTGTLKEILGQKDELMSSSDAAQDEIDRDQFVRKYRQMHRLARASNGAMVLYIGAENWPFPVPLVFHDGVWHYDSDAGEKEVLYRRIGENEVTAISACQALAGSLKTPQAQEQVASHGYSFRILKSPDNNQLELVAYPVEYGSSGVMTFMVNHSGVVYQKDLGASTQTVVSKMAAFHTDSTWTPVATEQANPG
jgi:hypothetical protein